MRLLLAEDDAALRDVLLRGLREAGYVVDDVADGEDALDHLAVYEYGVCVLDWRMPRKSGVEVVTEMRHRGNATPVLMLTARDAPVDRVTALDVGADDYLVKPFDYGELLARLRALLRRPGGDRRSAIRCGTLSFDPSTMRVTVDGAVLDITPRELGILELLLRRSPAVANRRSIALHAWPDESDAVGSNTIEVHIARLRSKIAGSTARIETVRGLGYRIESGDSADVG